MKNLILILAAFMIFGCSQNNKQTTAVSESAPVKPVLETEMSDDELGKSIQELQKQEDEENRKKYFSFTPKKLKLKGGVQDAKNYAASYYDGDNSFYDGGDYLFTANVFSGMIEFIDSSGDEENFHDPIVIHGTTFLKPFNDLSKENWDRIVVDRGLLKKDSYSEAKKVYDFIVTNYSKLLVSYVKGSGNDYRYYARVSMKKTGKIIWEE